MKKLERKWAKICFVLLVSALVLAVAPWALHVLVGVESKVYPAVFGILAALCLLAEFLLSRKFLRCPTCGKTTAPPRWDGKTRFRCVKCGRIFPFDDQPEIVYAAEDEDDEEASDDDEYEEDDESYDDAYDDAYEDEAYEDDGEALPVKEDK